MTNNNEYSRKYRGMSRRGDRGDSSSQIELIANHIKICRKHLN